MSAQSYKIFINNRLLLIANEAKKTAESPLFCMFLDYNWEKAILFLQKKGNQGAIIFTDTPKEVFKKVKSKFNYIKAAGGLVENPFGNILCIKRLGCWDFPKGKVERNETWKEAAIREVEEECGLQNIKLGKLAGVTYHTYEMNGKPYFKKTKWYYMYVKDYQNTTPQITEDITEIKWKHPVLIQQEEFDTYTSIRELIFDVFKSATK